MPQVRNNATGAIYELAGRDLQDALAAGLVTPLDDISVTNPRGDVRTVKPGALDTLAAQGYQVTDPRVLQQREQTAVAESRYGGLGQEALTGVEGLASGVTLGATDALLEYAGADTAERAKVNPNIRLGSELVGAIAPALLTGGGSAVAEGAGLAARTATTAGKILARTPAGLASRAGAAVTGLGREAGLIGRAVGAAAGGATEGALFGAGQAVTQLALEDRELTAERALSVLGSSVLQGVEIGALAGGVLSAGGDLFSAGKNKVGPKVRELAGNLTGKSSKEITEDIASSKQQFGAEFETYTQQVETYVRQSDALFKHVDDATWGVQNPEFRELSDLAGKNQDAFHRALANYKEAKFNLGEVWGKPAKASALVDELVERRGWLQLDSRKMDQILDAKSEDILGALGKFGKYEAALDEMDAAISPLTQHSAFQPAQALKGFEAPVRPAAPRAKFADQMAQVKETVEGGLSMTEKLALAQAGLQALGADPSNLPVVGSVPGVEWVLRAIAMKKLIGRAANKGLLRGLRTGGNSRIAGAASSAADLLNLATHGALGAVGEASKLAGKVVEKVKPAAVPGTLKILNGALFAPAEKIPEAATAHEAFKLRQAELGQALQDPQLVKAAMGAALGDPDPELLDAMHAAQMRKLGFLAEKQPRDPRPYRALQKEWRPTKTELDTWARYVRAAESPMSVLEDLQRGRVTPEGAETLRVVYPRLFSDVQVSLMGQAMKLQGLDKVTYERQGLSHRKLLLLSRLFQVALDDSLDPDFIRMMQTPVQEMEPTGSGGSRGSSGFSPPGITATTIDQMSGGDFIPGAR